MSLERIHDVAGLMQFAAQPVIGTTGTASSVASNQYPGGYAFGAYQGYLAGTNSTNGGAQVQVPAPRGMATSDFYNLTATSGVLSHDNAPAILISVSTTGSIYNIQQAASHGQILSIIPVGGTTASIASTLNTSGVNGTTTAACQVAQATTFASTGPCVLMALAQLGGTATTNVPYVWKRIV